MLNISDFLLKNTDVFSDTLVEVNVLVYEFSLNDPLVTSWLRNFISDSEFSKRSDRT